MTAIEFDHVGKQYRLGVVSMGTLGNDLKRWWTTSILRKEDPFLTVGEVNDRSVKGESEYVWALKDIDFKVEQGDVVGIIGRNGAGKSTLLKLLSRVTGPTVGEIRARGRIGSLLEVGTGFHPEMTGRENIYLNGTILGMTKPEIDRKLDEIIDFSGCERYIDTPVKRYSSGMMVRLGFAVAAHLEPEILIVDEVLAVGDAEFQKKAIGKMQDVSKGEGRTVLFVSHNMDSVLNLCHTGIILKNGVVDYQGDVKSAVSRYLSGGRTNTHYIQESPRSRIYTREAKFEGETNNINGMFSIDEDIILQVTFKKDSYEAIDKGIVASVCIKSERGQMIAISEIDLADLVNRDELTYRLRYSGSVLMPGNYLICVDIHIPNVCYLDRAETVTFSIFDNGTEFLKYGGTDNGIVFYRPIIEIC